VTNELHAAHHGVALAQVVMLSPTRAEC